VISISSIESLQPLNFYPSVSSCYSQNSDLLNLREIGLITDVTMPKYSFEDFDLQSGAVNRSYPLPHHALGLTQRGFQIANAVFATKEIPLTRRRKKSTFAT
jgi:hypothetical protein